MIRIQLDRIHLELLLLVGLFATFSGVAFPAWQNGMNVTPFVALGGGLVVGIGVLVHRRIFGDSADTRSRMRATIWFAFLGAITGATVSAVVVGTLRSMVIAATGAGLMFSAIGAQFGIVIKTRDEAAKEAVETVLDEENVFVTPEHFWSDATEESPDTESHTVNGSETSEERDDASDADDVAADSTNGDASTTGSNETENSARDEQIDDDIERVDVSSSSDWKQPSDDNIPIPVIRAIDSNDYSEE